MREEWEIYVKFFVEFCKPKGNSIDSNSIGLGVLVVNSFVENLKQETTWINVQSFK